MKKVARNFKKDSDESNLSGVRFSIVAAKNHYAGFGPRTVNIFSQLLGLEEVRWEDEIVMTDELAGKEDDDDYNHNAILIKTKQTKLIFRLFLDQMKNKGGIKA